jgi:hypothetical protein
MHCSFQGGPTWVSTHGQHEPLKQTTPKHVIWSLKAHSPSKLKTKIIEGKDKRHVEVQAHFPQRLKA